ncbi:hypothetical protein HY498_04255 [Candidatus Woesearchaeota archaeon]|nr:hypothetical protein [Candidatus Woesearchaeota archaeon]
MTDLLMFSGTECKHCHEMLPLVKKLEKELKVKVKILEVWHNAENAKLLQEKDTIGCGGIPFFYNEKTKKALCGSVSYEELKAWAQGK